MISVSRVLEASERIQPLVIKTPVTHDERLDLFLKWENRQVTGSFKIRGACNKVFSLEPVLLEPGLVTCSAGNHGQGVAFAAEKRHSNCIVYASQHAALTKLAAMERLGAQVRLVAGGYAEAEREARDYARERGMVFISPYNDEEVISGQGTIAVEIEEQLPAEAEIASLIVPVGGGGLISGLGAFFSQKRRKPRIIGIQSEASPYAHQVFTTGSQEGAEEKHSIADGLAGEIEVNSITIPMMQEYVDEIILVSEDEIREAIRFAWSAYGETIEGSAAVGLAARLAGKIHSQSSLTVITGGNIQPELLSEILRQQ